MSREAGLVILRVVEEWSQIVSGHPCCLALTRFSRPDTSLYQRLN